MGSGQEVMEKVLREKIEVLLKDFSYEFGCVPNYHVFVVDGSIKLSVSDYIEVKGGGSRG